MSPPSKPQDYYVGWICAVQTEYVVQSNFGDRVLLLGSVKMIRFSYSDEDTKDEEGREDCRPEMPLSRCHAPSLNHTSLYRGTHHNMFVREVWQSFLTQIIIFSACVVGITLPVPYISVLYASCWFLHSTGVERWFKLEVASATAKDNVFQYSAVP